MKNTGGKDGIFCCFSPGSPFSVWFDSSEMCQTKEQSPANAEHFLGPQFELFLSFSGLVSVIQ